jgi:hypothetical protein
MRKSYIWLRNSNHDDENNDERQNNYPAEREGHMDARQPSIKE